ncbi:MAG: hypothetical protein WAM42_07295 [Candidatus Nitrosopolaris sp.]
MLALNTQGIMHDQLPKTGSPPPDGFVEIISGKKNRLGRSIDK